LDVREFEVLLEEGGQGFARLRHAQACGDLDPGELFFLAQCFFLLGSGSAELLYAWCANGDLL
jgi:hypothetical protein